MNDIFLETPKVLAEGHVVIKDLDTNEIILDKYNAINFENLAYVIAQLLGNKTTGGNEHYITKMAFGHGGTIIDGNGNVSYKTPKVNGPNGALYLPSPAVADPLLDFTKDITDITVVNQETQAYTDLEMTVILDYNEPSNALATDTSADFEEPGDYVFDEIALVSGNDEYLTHLIFHPIQKSLNRKLEIIYSLRIRAGV